MALKAMTLVGLDAHAAQTHAAILDPDSGELRVSKLRMAPLEVITFLEGLGPGVRAVYEAGPTGFGLARAGRERGIDGEWWRLDRSRRARAIGSRPIVATRSASRGCWPPAS